MIYRLIVDRSRRGGIRTDKNVAQRYKHFHRLPKKFFHRTRCSNLYVCPCPYNRICRFLLTTASSYQLQRSVKCLIGRDCNVGQSAVNRVAVLGSILIENFPWKHHPES